MSLHVHCLLEVLYCIVLYCIVLYVYLPYPLSSQCICPLATGGLVVTNASSSALKCLCNFVVHCTVYIPIQQPTVQAEANRKNKDPRATV